jgi:hypothetical protein
MTLSIDVKPSTSTVSDKQEPVAWMSPSGKLYPTRLRAVENGEQMVTPLYATPVHASDMSEKHVHKSDKHRHEDWYGQHQWQCGYERGWDAAMEKKENSLPLMQEGKDFTVSKPWVGLTDVELNTIIAYNFNASHAEIGREIEAKLKEKNT